MVLSNRKLKQQLREKIADSLLTFEIVKSDPSNDGSANPDPSSQSQSLRALLGSATPKPSLSKRAKRRKIAALRGPAEVAGSGSGGNSEENQGDEEQKKEIRAEELGDARKRDEDETGDLKKEIGSESFRVQKKKKKEKSEALGNGDLEEEKKEIGSESLGAEKKKKKKRKRDEEERSGALSSEENGDVKEAKKPKKKKPKWKKKKEAKSEEEKKGDELVSEEKSVNETNKDTER